MRLLITGSRDWFDRGRIWSALDREWADVIDQGKVLTIVQGGADGADKEAHAWYRHVVALGFADTVDEDEITANWGRPCDSECFHRPRARLNGDRYCPRAGNLRNQEMVDKGAYKCLGFPLKNSRGTWDCMHRADLAGIPVVNLGWGGEKCYSSIKWHTMPHRGCFLQ